MNTQTLRNDTDLHQIVANAAAVFATAGGLIHLTVTRQHLDFPIVVAGFVLMGVAQWVFAFTILKRPTTVVANTGGVLHAAIVAVWILSRTAGLAFVPGAEHVASVGVADIVATTFSVAVIGTVVMWRALSESTGKVNVPNPGVRTVVAALAIGALFLTVPAIAAPHHHEGSHGEVKQGPAKFNPAPIRHEVLHHVLGRLDWIYEGRAQRDRQGPPGVRAIRIAGTVGCDHPNPRSRLWRWPRRTILEHHSSRACDRPGQRRCDRA